MSSARVLRLPALLLTLGVFFAPAAAQAKGLVVINTGDEIFEVGPLPDELKDPADPTMATWKLGWKCDRFGILWADVWTWNCGLVGYDGDNTYADLPPDMLAELEAKHPFSSAQRGFWNAYGFFILLIGIVGLVVVTAMAKDDGEES